MAQENLQVRVGATGLAESIRREAARAEAQLASKPIKMSLNTKGFRQPLGRITHDVSEFNKSMDASVARVLAFGAAMGVINSVSNAMKSMVTNAIKVEKSLMDINVILSLNNSSLAKFGDQLFDVARKTSQSFDTVSEAAVEFARQGLGAEETLKRINDAMILSRLSGLKATDSVASLTAAVNSYAKVGISTTQVINRLANVDAAFAVSSADLANAIQRAGASAQGAKVEFNELLAVVTSVQQQTARGGAVIGNAFKSIFTRMQRSGVRSALEELGVATENTNGSLRSGISVLRDYAKVYGTLTDQQKAYTDSQIAGLFQINNLKALLSDLTSEYSIYDKALNTANSSTNQAMQRNEELNKTLSSLLMRTGASVDELAAKFGELGASEGLTRLVNMVKGVADFLNSALGGGEDEGSSFAKNLVRGIGSFLTGPGLIIVGAALAKVFGQVAKFGTSAFREILGLNVEAKRQEALQKAIGATLSQNEKLYAQIMGLAGNTAKQEQVLLNYIKQETKERLAQEQIMKRIASSASFAGVGAGPEGFVPAGRRGAKKAGRRTLGMSGGFVPNFRKNPAQSAEYMGMVSGGYSKKALRDPKIKKTKIHDGKGQSFFAQTNGHENIKTFTNLSGKKATMVIPEARSDAFNSFSKGLRKKIASSGFTPNFSTLPSKFLNTKSSDVSAMGPNKISAKEFDASKLVSMIVPDVEGNHVVKGGVTMPEGHIQRVRFMKVGPSKDPKGRVKSELSKIAKNQISSGARIFSKVLDSQIAKGPIPAITGSESASTAGRIFESGVRSVLKSPSFGSDRATFDFIGGDTSKGGVFDWKTPLADAKTTNNPKNRTSVARKTISFISKGKKGWKDEYGKEKNQSRIAQIERTVDKGIQSSRVGKEGQKGRKVGRAGASRIGWASGGYVPSFFDIFGGNSNMGVDHLGAASGNQSFKAPMSRMVSETGSMQGKNLWKALEALGVSTVSKQYSLTPHSQDGFDKFVKTDSTAKKYANALGVQPGKLGAHKGDFFEMYNSKQKFGKDWKSGLSHADLPFDTKQPSGKPGIGESKAFDIMKGKSAAGQQANIITKSLFSDSDRGLFKGISEKLMIGPADSVRVNVPGSLASEMKAAGYDTSEGKASKSDIKKFAKSSMLGWRKTYNERKFQRAILNKAPMFKGNLKVPATVPFSGRSFRGKLSARRGLRNMGASGGYLGQGVREAIKREQAASGQKAIVERSKFLDGGVGVYNRSQQKKYGSLDRTIQRDHLGRGQLKSTLGETGSGKERYAARGFFPNFTPRWKGRAAANRQGDGSQGRFIKNKQKEDQVHANIFTKLAGGAQKIQKLQERFHLDKIDDVFQGLFSGGYVPNFSKMADLIQKRNQARAARKKSSNELAIREPAVKLSFAGEHPGKNPLTDSYVNAYKQKKISEKELFEMVNGQARMLKGHPKKFQDQMDYVAASITRAPNQIRRTKVDSMRSGAVDAAGGYIPNFAKKKTNSQQIKEKTASLKSAKARGDTNAVSQLKSQIHDLRSQGRSSKKISDNQKSRPKGGKEIGAAPVVSQVRKQYVDPDTKSQRKANSTVKSFKRAGRSARVKMLRGLRSGKSSLGKGLKGVGSTLGTVKSMGASGVKNITDYLGDKRKGVGALTGKMAKRASDVKGKMNAAVSGGREGLSRWSEGQGEQKRASRLARRVNAEVEKIKKSALKEAKIQAAREKKQLSQKNKQSKAQERNAKAELKASTTPKRVSGVEKTVSAGAKRGVASMTQGARNAANAARSTVGNAVQKIQAAVEQRKVAKIEKEILKSKKKELSSSKKAVKSADQKVQSVSKQNKIADKVIKNEVKRAAKKTPTAEKKLVRQTNPWVNKIQEDKKRESSEKKGKKEGKSESAKETKENKSKIKDGEKTRGKMDKMGGIFMGQMMASMALPYLEDLNNEQREGTTKKAASQAATNAASTAQFAMFLAFIPGLGIAAAGAVVGVSALIGAIDGLYESNEEAAERLKDTRDSRNKRDTKQSEARSGVMQSVSELRSREKGGDSAAIQTARDNVLNRLGGIANDKDRETLSSMVRRGESTKTIGTEIERMENQANSKNKARNRLSFVNENSIDNKDFGTNAKEIDQIYLDSASLFSSAISGLSEGKLGEFGRSLDASSKNGDRLSRAFARMRDSESGGNVAEFAEAQEDYKTITLSKVDIDQAESTLRMVNGGEVSETAALSIKEARDSAGNQASLKAIIVAMRQGNKRSQAFAGGDESSVALAGTNKAFERFGSELAFSERMFKQYNSMLNNRAKHEVAIMNMIGKAAIDLSTNFAKSGIDLSKNVAEFNVDFNQRLGSIGTYEAIEQRSAVRSQAMQANFSVDQAAVGASEKLQKDSLRKTTNNRLASMEKEYNNSMRRTMFDAAFKSPEKLNKEDKSLQDGLKKQISTGGITLDNFTSMVGKNVASNASFRSNANDIASSKQSTHLKKRQEAVEGKISNLRSGYTPVDSDGESLRSVSVIRADNNAQRQRLKDVGRGEKRDPKLFQPNFGFGSNKTENSTEAGMQISRAELYKRADSLEGRSAREALPLGRIRPAEGKGDWTKRGGPLPPDNGWAAWGSEAEMDNVAKNYIADDARLRLKENEKDMTRSNDKIRELEDARSDLATQIIAVSSQKIDKVIPNISTYEQDLTVRKKSLDNIGEGSLAEGVANEMNRIQLSTAAAMKEVANADQREQQKIRVNSERQTLQLELQRRIMEEQLKVEQEQAKKMAALDRLDKLSSSGPMSTSQIDNLQRQAEINTAANKWNGPNMRSEQSNVLAANSNRQIAEITGISELFSPQDKKTLAEFNVKNMEGALRRGGANKQADKLRENFDETMRQVESGDIQSPFLSESEKLNQTIKELTTTIENRLVAALESPQQVQFPDSMQSSLGQVEYELGRLSSTLFNFGGDMENISSILKQTERNEGEGQRIADFLKNSDIGNKVSAAKKLEKEAKVDSGAGRKTEAAEKRRRASELLNEVTNDILSFEQTRTGKPSALVPAQTVSRIPSSLVRIPDGQGGYSQRYRTPKIRDGQGGYSQADPLLSPFSNSVAPEVDDEDIKATRKIMKALSPRTPPSSGPSGPSGTPGPSGPSGPLSSTGPNPFLRKQDLKIRDTNDYIAQTIKNKNLIDWEQESSPVNSDSGYSQEQSLLQKKDILSGGLAELKKAAKNPFISEFDYLENESQQEQVNSHLEHIGAEYNRLQEAHQNTFGNAMGVSKSGITFQPTAFDSRPKEQAAGGERRRVQYQQAASSSIMSWDPEDRRRYGLPSTQISDSEARQNSRAGLGEMSMPSVGGSYSSSGSGLRGEVEHLAARRGVGSSNSYSSSGSGNLRDAAVSSRSGLRDLAGMNGSSSYGSSRSGLSGLANISSARSQALESKPFLPDPTKQNNQGVQPNSQELVSKLSENSEQLTLLSQSLSSISNSELVHSFKGNVQVDIPGALGKSDEIKAAADAFGERVEIAIRDSIAKEFTDRGLDNIFS